jgi:hypothetical protein
MEDARSYLIATAPATEGLFKLLNSYGWAKMRALVELTKSRTREELEEHKESFSSTDVAREVIAGSILQIAYVALSRYAVPSGKSTNALHFASEINRLIRENPSTRTKGPFSLPDKFCVGREIGHLPMGMLIYAGRNQYNHFGEERLSVVNEVVFNHLHAVWPSPPNGLTFDLYKEKRIHSYSILAALGWNDSEQEMGYSTYKRDMSDLLHI